MGKGSKIEWTDHTFNPWMGCTKVSPGCDGCYAEQATPVRILRARGFETWGPDGTRRRSYTWDDPPRWNKRHAAFFAQHGRRQRVFCASLADVFDNKVPAAWRVDLLRLIEATPQLDWLLLTKRIGNVDRMLDEAASLMTEVLRWPLPNVWLGATVVNQAEADRDIPKLLAVPARVRFLSVEPMLGPVDLFRFMVGDGHDAPYFRGGELHWVICGGESGPGARPMHPDWARSLRYQCAAAGVPFLFKQWGEWVPADDTCDGVFPVTQIIGDVDWREGKRVRVQWLSPNDSNVGHSFARIGKKAAGRLLDGVEHNGFPEAPHA